MRVSTRLIAAAALFGSFAAASADDSGIAAIHQWRKVGSRTCFVDHTHDGTGTGSTQKAAMAAAIESWRGYTDLEYGSDWAVFSNSIEKTAACKASGSGFECTVVSTPCKGGVLVQHERRRTTKRHVAQVKPQ